MRSNVHPPPPLVLGAHRWDWSRPYLMGIVNVTPDSFSDGGQFATPAAAIEYARALVAQGADAVSAAEQIARVIPVVRALAANGVLVSVDTTLGDVADAAFEAGAWMLNDVGMGEPIERLAASVARRGGAYLRMHSRGTPATMASRATYEDLVPDVVRELSDAAHAIERSGVAADRIVLDPGIGFAKRAAQSLELLARIAPVAALGYAVCVGPSRKSFIAAPEAYAPAWRVEPDRAVDRLGGTAAAVALAVAGGAHVLRVHDVAVMRQAARVAHAIALREGP